MCFQFNHFFHLRVKEVGVVVEQQLLLISPIYRLFGSKTLIEGLLCIQTKEQPWVDCLLCIQTMEDGIHNFIWHCLLARQIWDCVFQIWQVLSCCYLTHATYGYTLNIMALL